MAKKKAAPGAEQYESVRVKLNRRLTELGAGLHDMYAPQTICEHNYDATGWQKVQRTPFVESRLKADELIEYKAPQKKEAETKDNE